MLVTMLHVSYLLKMKYIRSMDTSEAHPKPNRLFSVFRLLNASSIALWFFYTKGTIGTPVFPYLLALHVFALVGFVYCWYKRDSKNAGRAIALITAMTILSLGLFFLYGRR